MGKSTEEKFSGIKSRIPSWAWILIFLCALAVFIGLITGTFYVISHVEGVASIIFLVMGIVSFGVFPLRKPKKLNPLIRAVGIAFFGLMGAAVDQPGNFIYNQPIGFCLCDNSSTLERRTDTFHPLPERTDYRQVFMCIDNTGNSVKTINEFIIAGFRFAEYMLIGYLLLLFRFFFWRLKHGN